MSSSIYRDESDARDCETADVQVVVLFDWFCLWKNISFYYCLLFVYLVLIKQKTLRFTMVSKEVNSLKKWRNRWIFRKISNEQKVLLWDYKAQSLLQDKTFNKEEKIVIRNFFDLLSPDVYTEEKTSYIQWICLKNGSGNETEVWLEWWADFYDVWL